MKRVLLSIVLAIATVSGFLLPAATLVAFAESHALTNQNNVVWPDGTNPLTSVGDRDRPATRATNAGTFGDAIREKSITGVGNHTGDTLVSSNLPLGETPKRVGNSGDFVEAKQPSIVSENDFSVLSDSGSSTGAYPLLTVAVSGNLSGPSIAIEKQVSIDGGASWLDADTPPGPSIFVPGTVDFRVIVTNTGNVTLTNVAVSDNTTLTFAGVATSLAVGASSTSNITSTAALVGLHSDMATVTALYGTLSVTANNTAYYTGLVAPSVFTTRSQGFWQTHTAFTSDIFAQFFAGGIKIGVAPHKGTITNIQQTDKSQFFGAFYASIGKTTSRSNRSELDKARMILLQQLVAAKLNAAAFGASAATLTLISNSDAAYAGTNVALILDLANQLDTYNNSGDALPLPSGLPEQGSATPQTSRTYADLAFWDAP